MEADDSLWRPPKGTAERKRRKKTDVVMDSEDSDSVTANDHLPSSISPKELLRMKDIMANQCFDMNIKVNMADKSTVTPDAEADLSKYEKAIQEARTTHFNKTLALNRMQVWNAIIEKVLDDTAEAASMKKVIEENADLCEKAMKVKKETRELQDQITDIQKERLELKRLTRNKMQEINELKQVEVNENEAQKQAIERAEEILQKYKKIATISQNVLRGIIIASKINWIDDPKLKEIAMGLENIPE